MGLLIEKNTTKYKSKLSNLRQGIPKHIGFLLIMTETFTSNYVYYLFLILFRFIGILIFSGDFGNNLLNTNYNSFPKWLHNITIFKIIKKIKFSITSYIVLSIILFILFISRLLSYLTLYYSIVQKKNEIAKIILYRHQIFFDNLLFLLYPFLLEYLSLSYYIFFISDFVINKKNIKNYILIFIIVINTILIIGYNFLNCIFILICNKIYNSSIHDAFSKISKINLNKIKRPIKYNYNSLTIFFILLIPNFIVFSPLVYYLNENSLNKFNKIISVVIFISLFLLFLSNIKTFNYPTSINTITGIITMYCFLSILLDLLLFYFKYNIITVTSCIFYNIIKLIISCVTFYFFMVRINNYILKKVARSVIFQEENTYKNEEEIFDGLLFLQELMYNIIYEDDQKSFMIIVDILNSHIINCKDLKCKCKFVNFFYKKYNTLDFINHINFLLETCYIEYYFTKNVKFNIIIAEHYCNLKKNPTMSYSIIETLLTILKKNLHTFELVNLFLLVEKYIFYILAYSEKDIVHNTHEKIKNESIQLINKKTYYNNFFIAFISAIKIKNLLYEYLENEIKIIKYKNLYEESLIFKFDEIQENIISVETEFFKNYREFGNNRGKEGFFCSIKKTNLTSIITLLLKENEVYHDILNLIQDYHTHKNMPVHFMFRLFIFYDLFFGGNLPNEIYKKIYSCFTDNKNLYHKTISTEAYNVLIETLLNKDEKSNSKYYSIFQFKKGLRVLYFNETEAVKLGYKQKDLFKKNIDVLMPKEFSKSHYNLIKRFFIYKQNKLFKVPKSFLFHKDEMNMYPIESEGSMILGLDKYFIVFKQTMSIEKENEYHMMFDNNFELIAHTKNFEKDYSLNKYILNSFKINIIQIFNIKFKNLYNQYINEMKDIHFQKKILQGKTEEYLMRLFFKQKGLLDVNNKGNRRNLKSDKVYKILDNLDNNNFETQNNFNFNEGKLLQNKESKKIMDLIINDKLIEKIHYKKITSSINKKRLIQNLLQKLYKIEENDLVNESNKGYSDYVIASKNKLNELLKANLSENFYNIEIQLTLIYDKFFYFIKITECSKNSNFLPIKSTENFSPISEKLKQNANKNLLSKKETNLNDSNLIKKDEEKKIENKNTEEDNNFAMNLQNEKSSNNNNLIITEKLNKIKDIKKQIDNDKFISIIKLTLVILLLIIFIIYILIMRYHLHTVSSCYKIFYIYYYNQYSKDILLNMYSILLSIFNQINNITSNNLFKINDLMILLGQVVNTLKESNHNFTHAVHEYNDGFNVIYKQRVLYKIRNEWNEVNFTTDFNRELEAIMYYGYDLLKTNFSSIEIIKDSNNFFLYKGIINHNETINTGFIKLLSHFTKNYYNIYEDIFDEIHETYSKLFNNSIKNIKIYYLLFACFSIFLFVLLFSIIIIYLYYSNLVIFNNILFLFLDFTQDKEKYVWGKDHDNKYIIYKIQNFKLLVIDFDYELLNKFIKTIDNKNFKREISMTINDENSELNIYRNNTILPRNFVMFNNETNKRKSIIQINNIAKIQKTDYRGMIVNNKTKPDFESIGNEKNFITIRKKILINNDNVHGSFHTNFDKSNSGLMLNNSKQEIKTNIIKKQLNQNYKSISNNKENTYIGGINIQDIIMKKSEKLYIFKIKFYIIFNIVFGVCFIIYTLFKTIYNFHSYNKILTSFDDFKLVIERYAILYYYFNNLKTLLITGDNYHKSLMDGMDSKFQNISNLFSDFISRRLKLYSNLNDLKGIFINSENKTTALINEVICKNEDLCKILLNSNYNMFSVGIDFFCKSSFTHISNVLNDYSRNENNVANIEDIHKLFINNIFERIDLSLNFVLIYAKKKIYLSFYDDIREIITVYDHNGILFDVISMACPVLIFIFMILFVFKSIYNQSQPIKESTRRVSNSFILIKNYNGDKIKVDK